MKKIPYGQSILEELEDITIQRIRFEDLKIKATDKLKKEQLAKTKKCYEAFSSSHKGLPTHPYGYV